MVFPYSYAFTVKGVPPSWASAQDLKEVIARILKEYMPKGDTKDMAVNVQVVASLEACDVIDEELYE